MPFAFVTSAKIAGTGSGAGPTSAINTTGADFLFVATGWYSGGTTSPVLTDSKSNTWVALTTHVGSIVTTKGYYCVNPTVGSGHTFTLSGVQYSPIQVWAFSGINQSGNAFGAQAATPVSGNSPQNAGSVTPDVNGCLLITTSCFQFSPLSLGSGYTWDGTNFVGGASQGGASGYLIQGTAANINPTWTDDSGFELAVTHQWFRPVASGRPNKLIGKLGGKFTGKAA